MIAVEIVTWVKIGDFEGTNKGYAEVFFRELQDEKNFEWHNAYVGDDGIIRFEVYTPNEIMKLLDSLGGGDTYSSSLNYYAYRVQNNVGLTGKVVEVRIKYN